MREIRNTIFTSGKKGFENNVVKLSVVVPTGKSQHLGGSGRRSVR
jgi:hypothetical protein